MKIIINRIPEYRIWRTGTKYMVPGNPVNGSKGKPGSKLAKKMIRQNIREAVRSARLKENSGKGGIY